MKVKVCGITNIDDALLCEDLGADALGYVFCKESKRYISPSNAAVISRRLSPFTLKAGVFVNASYEEITGAAEEAGLNIIQLHGSEPPEFVRRFNIPVIKSFRVGGDFQFSDLSHYTSYYLLDSFNAVAPGGTGTQFNWNIIPADLQHKIILAGGISVHNIENVINNINPAAVDLSSSIESAPGKKDILKTTEFFNKLNTLRRTRWLS